MPPNLSSDGLKAAAHVKRQASPRQIWALGDHPRTYHLTAFPPIDFSQVRTTPLSAVEWAKPLRLVTSCTGRQLQPSTAKKSSLHRRLFGLQLKMQLRSQEREQHFGVHA